MVRRVRQAATGTAVGAAMMLFFGFLYLARPSGTDLFGQASVVVYHAMRIGGAFTAGIACWLWFGHLPALIVDSLVAMGLGCIFVVGAGVMLMDGGDALQSVIIGFCGVTFFSSGMRNGKAFAQLSRRISASIATPLSIGSTKERDAKTAPTTTRVQDALDPVGGMGTRPKDNVGAHAEPVQRVDSGAADEGYLASFARRTPPHQPPR